MMIRDSLKVLVVDDSPEDAELLVRELKKSGIPVEHLRVQTPGAMREALQAQDWDVILADYSLPQFDALSALEILHQSDGDIPFIVLSGAVGEDVAVSVMKAGAHDFLTKDRLNRLIPAVEREIGEAESRRERRVFEAQLRQAQKMEAVGRLAGGIAHDFNNILMLIMGNAHLVLEGLDPANSVYPYVQQIEKASKRAAGLTAQLLTFSRKQASHMRLISVNDILDETHAMLDRLLGEDIDLKIAKGDGIGPVRADPTQISQVIINLAINARDAMPEGGPLHIETHQVLVDSASRHPPGVEAGQWVVFLVRDAGCGMDFEIQSQVFEPFFTTKEPGKGTGLGLSTAYGIIKQTGGHILVESQVGEGATFFVYLPLASAQEEAETPQQTPSTPRALTGRVLLVEDEEPVRVFVAEILEREGFDVTHVCNAELALEAFDGEPESYQLLLTDVVMPGLRGTELADRICQHDARMPVLFMSGYPGDSDLTRRLEEGTRRFLRKPFSPDELIDAVHELLGSGE